MNRKEREAKTLTMIFIFIMMDGFQFSAAKQRRVVCYLNTTTSACFEYLANGVNLLCHTFDDNNNRRNE